MRKLLLIAVMLALPAAALAGVSPQVIVSTDFEAAPYGAFTDAGVEFDGAQWRHPWYGGTEEVRVIDDPTGAGKGKVVAFQTTGVGNNTRLVANRLARPPLPPGDEWLWDPVGDPNWSDAYYPYGTVTHEVEFFCLSNLGDWSNFMANYYKAWTYFESVGDTIDLLDPDSPSAGWDWHGAWKIPVGPLPVDQWFTTTLEYTYRQPDPLNPPEAGTYDFYINGVQVADDMPGNHWNDNYMEWNFELLDAFLEPIGGPEALGLGYVLISEVNWTWEAPEPSILALGGFGLVTLLLRRRKK